MGKSTYMAREWMLFAVGRVERKSECRRVGVYLVYRKTLWHTRESTHDARRVLLLVQRKSLVVGIPEMQMSFFVSLCFFCSLPGFSTLAIPVNQLRNF